MSPKSEQVFQIALSLPSSDQLELIEALIAELDLAQPQPLDDEWLEEIQRRSADYDAGRMASVPWAVVRARARGGDAHHG